MVASASAVSVGISNALDVALNQGKNNVLKRFSEIFTEKPKQKRPIMSERAMAIFAALPVKKGEK